MRLIDSEAACRDSSRCRGAGWCRNRCLSFCKILDALYIQVDAWDHDDYALGSALGRYDGNVYQVRFSVCCTHAVLSHFTIYRHCTTWRSKSRSTRQRWVVVTSDCLDVSHFGFSLVRLHRDTSSTSARSSRRISKYVCTPHNAFEFCLQHSQRIQYVVTQAQLHQSQTFYSVPWILGRAHLESF